MQKKIILVGVLTLFIFFAGAAFSDTQVIFSPNGGCTDAIVKAISQAQKTIDIMMYSFSSRPIAQELVKAKDRGVKIRILLDKAQEKQTYSKSRYFVQRDFDVRYDSGSGLMHNKAGIVDGRLLITGSFNWTAQAEKFNAENLLLLTDTTLINAYQERFNHLWEKGRKGLTSSDPGRSTEE
jgi:phosphatidylserine/phosphatidylglycerophosphate/cardiolipin synthase-like enzyme